MNENWFALSVDRIERKLKTNAAKGLSPKAARSRCKSIDRGFFFVKKKPWYKILAEILRDAFVVMLLIVALASLFFEGERIFGVGVLILLVINISMEFALYFSDRRTMDSMTEMFLPSARVIRGGRLYITDYKSVVPGDVILFEKGDMIGCDARLVHSEELSVIMQVEKDRTKELKKYANGSIPSREIPAEEMENMVHAGSVVSNGSGRAIVVTVGEYTYLGAISGGITEMPVRELPTSLASLKKLLSSIGMLLLLLTIPICIMGLLFAKFAGGTVLLSDILAITLSLGATMMLSRSADLYIGFFVRFIRGMALAQNPCVFRSVKGFETLAKTDCLLVLDGGIATDGIYHFSSLLSAEGEIGEFDYMSQSAQMLCDVAGMYLTVKKNALATGFSGNKKQIFDIGLEEFAAQCRIDSEALKIKYEISSFLPAVESDGRDLLIYDCNNDTHAVFGSLEKNEIRISGDSSAVLKHVQACRSAIVAGEVKTLSREGRAKILDMLCEKLREGNRLLSFIGKADGEDCLLGVLVFSEGVAPTFERSLDSLRSNGVKVMSFRGCKGRRDVPELPKGARAGTHKAISADEMRSLGISMPRLIEQTDGIDEYIGFGEEDILKMVRAIKAMGRTVAILGFSDYAVDAINEADAFLTCAPIRPQARGHLEVEISSREIPGGESSASCAQTTKSMADALLMRPKGDRGGILPLLRSITCYDVAVRNLNGFLRYLFIVQLMRIVAVAIPMIFGSLFADARQLLFLGGVLDMLAYTLFVNDTARGKKLKKNARKDMIADGGIKATLARMLKHEDGLTYPAILGAALVVLLPNLLAHFGIIKDADYVFPNEFSLTALMLMQVLLLVLIKVEDRLKPTDYLKVLKEPMLIIIIGVCVAFEALCLGTRVGEVFGVVNIPLSYFLLSLLPAIVFFVCCILFTLRKRGKKDKKERSKR